MLHHVSVLFVGTMFGFALFLWFIALLTLVLAFVYGMTHKSEPVAHRRFTRDELPRVTVQLPIRNEGALSERVIQSAAALEYPADRLEIQIVDDSNDGETSAIIDRTIADLRRERPAIDVSVVRRDTRQGFKAGALRQGAARATGEFFAVFDADFVIPPSFLDETIHFFADPSVGIVQSRWAYMNRHRSTFTRFQATKLDAHQMFEQTARARTGLWVHFHGTAGILRRDALDAVGGWNCLTEVEDIELSIQTYLKGWNVVYLDRLRVPSELPETMSGFLVQQMRWKRGWIRVLKHYGWEIWKSPAPLLPRLDILVRLLSAFVPAVSLAFMIGALPAALLAERVGFPRPASLVYLSLVVIAVLQRMAELRFIDDSRRRDVPLLWRWVEPFLPVGLVLNMGLTPALTWGTLEGFGRRQHWDVTPKGTAAPGAASRARIRVPASIWVTLVAVLVAAGLLAVSVWTGHLVAGLFYLLMLTGSSWIAGAFLRERSKAS